MQGWAIVLAERRWVMTQQLANAGNARDFGVIDGGDSEWSSVSNATGAPDGNFATMTDNGNGSDGLVLYNFGFSVSGTINGITVALTRKGQQSGGEGIIDGVIQLTATATSGSVIPLGNNKADTTDLWPTSAGGAKTYGSGSDLWGTTLTAAQINSTAFGVIIQCLDNTGGGLEAFVDGVLVTINYTPSGGGGDTDEAAVMAPARVMMSQPGCGW